MEKTVLKYLADDGVTWLPFTGDIPAPTASIVVKEPITGSGASFTTSQPYVAGTLQAYVNGLAQSGFIAETDPLTGAFTLDTAVTVDDDKVAYYHIANTGVGNADTVDNYHASTVPQPNSIPVAGSDGRLPVKSIPGVAFKARYGANRTSGVNAAIQFMPETINYNYGGGYNGTTGMFTAPVAGIYSFGASAHTETTTTVRAFFITRGTATAGTNPNGTARSSNRGLDLTTAGGIMRFIGSWDIYMNEGDTFNLDLWTNAANQLNHADSWFSGHLVMAV